MFFLARTVWSCYPNLDFRAGFLPGAVLIISKWYLPNETQTRIAILYTSAASGGAFSGLLAFGIAKLDGVAGYEGWRWVGFTPYTVLSSPSVLTNSSLDIYSRGSRHHLPGRWLLLSVA